MKVLQDQKFIRLVPDMAFALHNIPGYPLNSIIIKEGCFSVGSAGIESVFTGKTSHAGEPDKGKNPALAVSQIIQEMYNLNKNYNSETFITVVHVDIGEKAYGTSPGNAELRCTIRSAENSSMMKIAAEAENIVTNISVDHNLRSKINIVEEFPPVMNDPDMVKIVVDSAKNAGLEVIGMGGLSPGLKIFPVSFKILRGVCSVLGRGKIKPNCTILITIFHTD